MVKIEAIIRPSKLDSVKEALEENGISGLTVSHVLGSGKQRGRMRSYRGTEYVVHLLDKVKVEVVALDDAADEVMDIIADAASTGEIGDGKIFVTDVGKAMRIRTRERGESAVV